MSVVLETDARLEALLIEGLVAGNERPVNPEFWYELRRDAENILALWKQSGQTSNIR